MAIWNGAVKFPDGSLQVTAGIVKHPSADQVIEGSFLLGMHDSVTTNTINIHPNFPGVSGSILGTGAFPLGPGAGVLDSTLGKGVGAKDVFGNFFLAVVNGPDVGFSATNVNGFSLSASAAAGGSAFSATDSIGNAAELSVDPSGPTLELLKAGGSSAKVVASATPGSSVLELSAFSGVLVSDEGDQATVGAAGSAAALPSAPATYLKLHHNGVAYVVPLYLAS